MLKGIDPLLNPTLLHLLATMGHGDEILVVDANYPAHAIGVPVVESPGAGTAEIISAIISVMPVDGFTDDPVIRMAVVGDRESVPAVAVEAHRAIEEGEGREVPMVAIEREEFYRRAKQVFAVVITGEIRSYGCFIIRKGVWPHFVPA